MAACGLPQEGLGSGALVIESLLKRKIEKRPDKVRLPGRILFLTEDPELIRRQLAGEDLPWDTAAGVLLVEEAGGMVSDFSGGAFQLNSRETVASNGLIHAALLGEFGAIFAGRGLEELPNPVEYARTRGK